MTKLNCFDGVRSKESYVTNRDKTTVTWDLLLKSCRVVSEDTASSSELTILSQVAEVVEDSHVAETVL